MSSQPLFYYCYIDVAEKVFDKCIKGNGLPFEHPLYEINCSYEFLEDSFTEWGPSVHDYRELQLMNQHLGGGGGGGGGSGAYNAGNSVAVDKQKKSYLNVIGEKLHLPGYMKKQTERKRNHPLKFMVSFTLIHSILFLC